MSNSEDKAKIYGVSELRAILSNSEFIFSKLFKLYSTNNTILFSKEFIDEFNNYITRGKNYFNKMQFFFLSKIMLYIISYYEKQSKISDYQDMENKYLKLIHKNISQEYDLKPEDEKKDLDDIIINIIISLIYAVFKNKNYEQFKQRWDKLGLNLENFEMNKKMKEALSDFIGKNKEIKDYYKKMDISKDPKILKRIYIYNQYELNKEKILKEISKENKSLKYFGDEEREKNDFGRNFDFDDHDIDANENPKEEKKIIKVKEEFMDQVFEQLKIQIKLKKPYKDGPTRISYELLRGNDEQKSEFYNFHNKNLYNEDNTKEKNYKRYLVFIEQVTKYVRQNEYNIKLNKDITMILTKDEERIKNNDLYFVNCLSFYEDDKGKKYEYIDEDVLDYGIYGKRPGFIYLVNELCNDDYRESN